MNDNSIKKLVFILVALSVMGKILGMNGGSYRTKNIPQSSTYFDKSVADKDVLLRGVNKIKNSTETFHLFSHGQEGKLFINGEWRNAQQIAAWFKQNSYLTQKSHLNIYGCNFAQGVVGAEAVAYLEKELGVSVAASNNITGKDGDWTLEVGQAVAAVSVPNYQGNLQLNPTSLFSPTTNYALSTASCFGTLLHVPVNGTDYVFRSGANGCDVYKMNATSGLLTFSQHLNTAAYHGGNVRGLMTSLTLNGVTYVYEENSLMADVYKFSGGSWSVIKEYAYADINPLPGTNSGFRGGIATYVVNGIPYLYIYTGYLGEAGNQFNRWQIDPATGLIIPSTQQTLLTGGVNAGISMQIVETGAGWLMVTQGPNGIRFWDMDATGKLTGTYTDVPVTAGTSAMVMRKPYLDANGNLVMAGGDAVNGGRILVYNPTTKTAIKNLVATVVDDATYGMSSTNRNYLYITSSADLGVSTIFPQTVVLDLTYYSVVASGTDPDGGFSSNIPGFTSNNVAQYGSDGELLVKTTAGNTFYLQQAASCSNYTDGWVSSALTTLSLAAPVVCNSALNAMTLSKTNIAATCPATTVSLSGLVTSTIPAGTTLEWHTARVGLGANTKVANPLAVGAGVYYPVCYDAVANCYSPAPAIGVTVTVTYPCPCSIGSTIISQYATTSSGGYSGATSGSGAPDGTGLSVYTIGTTYQGIFTYANAFTAGSSLAITAKYNDTRVDGIFLAFSTDGVTWTANSPLINAFSSVYSTIYYMVPATMTGAYKYVRVQGNTANTYLNIDAIQENKTLCTLLNVGTYYDGGTGGGIKGNCTKDGTESATGLPSNLYINFVQSGVVVKSFPVTGGTTAIHSLANGTYTMVIAQTPTATIATTGDYSSLNGTQTVSIAGGVVTSPTTAFSFCIQALDSDNDGIPNGTDLDDDNDGILDVNEQTNCGVIGKDLTTLTFNGTGVTSKTANSITSSSTGGWLASYSNQDFTLPIHLEYKVANQTGISMIGLFPSAGTQTAANWQDGGYKLYNYGSTVYGYLPSVWTFSQAQVANELYEIDIDATGFVTAKVGGVVKAQFQGTNSTYKLVVSGYTAQTMTNIKLGDANSVYTCSELDTDGDGIPNRLDLDSDGDGCSDALEGGAWLSKPDLIASTMPGGSTAITQNLGNTVGNTATTMGIPTIAKEGQTVGSSTTKTVQDLACNCTSYIMVNTQAAIISSGGYSAPTAGANPADGAGMSVYTVGTTYQGIFTYANTFTAGSSLAITAKYNDTRTDGILLAFSADGTTWTANSPLINGFSSNYTTVNYVVPLTMTGAYKYIRVQGNSANTYLNIDAIQENTAICTLFNVGLYLDNGAGSGIKGNGTKEGGESATGLPSNLYVNFVQNGAVVKSFPVTGATLPIIYLNTGTYTMVLANSATKTTAITGDYSCLNGTQTVTLSAGGVVTGLTLPFSYGVQAIDSDNDGIADGADLDDDNDGILDVNEQTKCGFIGKDLTTLTFNGTAIASKTANSITSANLGGWVSSYSNQNLTLPIHLEYKISSQSVYSMIGLLPSAGTQTTANWNDGAYKFYNNGATANGYFPSAWTFSQAQVANELYEIDIDATGFVTAKIGGVIKAQFQGTNSTYKLAISSYTGQTMANIVLADANTVYTCTELDTDGDGIPNRLDLDSDGDGCSDALEGDASLVYKDLVNSTMAGGSTNITVNLGNRIGYTATTLGIPASANTGQAVGSSAIASINTCPCLYGENKTSLYPTSATGNSSTSWGDNAGVLGEPNVTSAGTDIVANRLSIYNTTPGIINFANPIYAGDSIIMYVAHWAGYTGGFDVSLNGTSGNTGTIKSVTSAQLTAITYPYNQIKFVVPSSLSGSFSSIKIMPNNVGGTSLLLFDAIKVVKTSCNSCPSGSEAPKLSTTTLTYNSACSQLTEFNLSTITASNQPSGSELTWHTDTPATSDNLAVSLTSAPSGIYYAAFYNLNTDCYSGFNGDGTATTKVIVSPDSDGDGVLDIMDLDDDNDGILDINEQANCGYVGKDLTTLTFNGSAIASKAANSITCANTGWLSSYSNENLTLPIHLEYKVSSQSAYSMIGLLPSAGTQTTANWNDGAYKFYNYGTTLFGYFPSAWTFSQAQVANELYTIDINATGYVTVKVGGVVKAQFQGANSTYKLAISSYTGQTMTNIKLADAYSGGYKCTEIDTDGDGIPNQLDLDSDGDGCPDALEGGGGFNSSNVYPSSMQGGSTNVTSNLCPTTTCIDSSGVPVAAGSAGQTVGSSQNSGVKSSNCPY